MSNHLYFHLNKNIGAPKTLAILGRWSYTTSNNDLIIQQKNGVRVSVSTLANFVGSTGIQNIMNGGGGVTGPTGVGSSGYPGAIGSRGESGINGPTGDVGSIIKGTRGSTGLPSDNIKGDTGIQINGAILTGDTGPTGARGISDQGVQGATGVLLIPAPVSTLKTRLTLPGFPSNSQKIYITGPDTLISTVRVPPNVSMLKITNIAGGSAGGKTGTQLPDDFPYGGKGGGTVIFTTLCTPGQDINCIMSNYGTYSNYGTTSTIASIVSYNSTISYAFYPSNDIHFNQSGYCTSGHAYILTGCNGYSSGVGSDVNGLGALGGAGIKSIPETTIYWSSNGSNWSNANKGGFNVSGNDIAYNNGLWVSVGVADNPNNNENITSILYSTDGSNWSNINNGRFVVTAYNSVTYGNGLWVTGGISDSHQSTIQYSTNGSDWYAVNTGGFVNGSKSITYANNLWMAVGKSDSPQSSIQYSKDGSNWSTIVGGGFTDGFKVTYANNLWVAVGGSNTEIPSTATPENPVITNPSALPGPFSPRINEMSFSSYPSTIVYSADGSNWYPTKTGGFFCGINVTYANNLWMAVGISDSRQSSIQYSKDGSNWSTIVSGGFFGAVNVTYANNLWVAVGVSDSRQSSIQYSTNGSNWYPANTGGFEYQGTDIGSGTDITYANNLWMAAGISTDINNSILYSSDGSNWSNTSNNGNKYNSQPFSFKKVKYNNGIWTSSGAVNHPTLGGGMGAGSLYGGGGAGGSYFDPNGYPGGYGAGGGCGTYGGEGGAGGPALVVLEFM